MKRRVYSPALDPELISPLYRTAKSRNVPMTKLASRYIKEGLEREMERENQFIVREEPPAVTDPGRRK